MKIEGLEANLEFMTNLRHVAPYCFQWSNSPIIKKVDLQVLDFVELGENGMPDIRNVQRQRPCVFSYREDEESFKYVGLSKLTWEKDYFFNMLSFKITSRGFSFHHKNGDFAKFVFLDYLENQSKKEFSNDKGWEKAYVGEMRKELRKNLNKLDYKKPDKDILYFIAHSFDMQSPYGAEVYRIEDKN